MYVLGFTLNNLTLVALIIAVGFIVDDAIVVVENIHRHLEAGASKVEAALKGAAEIGFTVISISFSLIAAFIPLLFMGGIVGRLFREFAVSVTVAILISVVASLTLAPMLASRFMPALRHAEAPRKGFAEWLTGGYERGLRWALGHQRLMLVGFAFTVLVAVAGYVGIPKGFFPCRTPPSSSARARLPRISPTTTWSPSTGNWPRSSPATRRCRATTMRWASPAVARAWPTGVSGSSSGPWRARCLGRRVHRPAAPATGQGAGNHALPACGAGHQPQFRTLADPVPVRPAQQRQHPAGALGATPHRAPEAGAGADGCVQRPAGRRQRHRAGHRPGGRGAFRPQRRGCQPDPLRRLRPAPGRRVPDRGQPVQGGPRTRCASAAARKAWTGSTCARR